MYYYWARSLSWTCHKRGRTREFAIKIINERSAKIQSKENLISCSLIAHRWSVIFEKMKFHPVLVTPTNQTISDFYEPFEMKLWNVWRDLISNSFLSTPAEDDSSSKLLLVCSSFKDDPRLNCFSIFPDCDPNREFSCNDGSCIPATDRCNRHEDCPAGDDEAGCGKLTALSVISQ